MRSILSDGVELVSERGERLTVRQERQLGIDERLQFFTPRRVCRLFARTQRVCRHFFERRGDTCELDTERGTELIR